jgi:DNA-binding XRE family transcriptional regulator
MLMAIAKQKPAKAGPVKLVPEPLATLSNAPPEPSRSLEKALGLQVRLLRREQELSLNELAAAAGISVGMMSKIENGQISPSLSTIRALAQALNTPFTSLFASFEEKRDCSYVPKGKGVVIERRGSKAGHVYELLGAVLGGDTVVEPYLITLQSDAEAYTGFKHAGIELIYMLTGEVVYRHSEQTFRLKPGDTLLFDSGALHGPETLVKVPMTYLSIIVYPRGR